VYQNQIVSSIGITRHIFRPLDHAANSVLCIPPCVRKGTDAYSPRKPKNARSKRALESREPKEVEDPRTAIFVKGTHTGERLNAVMQELVRREYPLCPSFS